MRTAVLHLLGCIFLVNLLIPHSVLGQSEQTISTQPDSLPTIVSIPPSLEGAILKAPALIRTGEVATFSLSFSDSTANGKIELQVQDTAYSIQIEDGNAEFSHSFPEEVSQLTLSAGGTTLEESITVFHFPPWLSILPPIIAIFLALIIREVIISLFAGIFLGAAIWSYYQTGSLLAIFTGFLKVADTYMMDALTSADHQSIILFSILIGGLVSVISRNGGMQGVVNRIAKIANTPKSVQLSTWFMGLIIFFDDYANTLVVGNTMRSITDKLRVSREKLSYIVDSTAAPVAALAFITTWIGAELSYIEGGVANLANFPQDSSAYSIFLHSIPFSFYPILTLVFILMVVLTGRDFGPMLKAERRARATGKVFEQQEDVEMDAELSHFQPAPGVPIRAWNAAIPIVILVFGVIIGLLYTGWDSAVWAGDGAFLTKVSTTIGNADSYVSLIWASICSLAVAIFMTLAQKLQKLDQVMSTMMAGFKAMLNAIVILTLAWSMQGLTEDMHTAEFLRGTISDHLAPFIIPVLTFLLAGFVAFSTGSSWGTMAILYPLLIPLAWNNALDHGLTEPEALAIFYHVVSAVLAGSVLGDHCSPISDTTILSSLASSCNHIDHVRTQLPYALVVGAVSILVGSIPVGLGMSPWLSFPFGVVLLFGILKYFGKPTELGATSN
ncbi:Na+/H+ antiporter NhaC family protein [Pontibacter sp. G13]|uniref:Na+/H+ antiporter NhaC family protein n=1 Tax=Pontibacter sp. G13 TaxID=3074898 RepID=UPI002889A26C|nr:Na+/H+ antiporter NhaC family protein [Pontibacter sp. G13]WNJ21486.1 Na+/H+ antiporter NhaC family protein [Pontibacter sp. G13]